MRALALANVAILDGSEVGDGSALAAEAAVQAREVLSEQSDPVR